MKLGCQSAPTNETHLRYLARYGVRNICAYPQIAGDRIYATVDELKQMRELAEKNGITVDCTAPPFLESSHIDNEKHPAIMLAQNPERDRDIESLQTMIKNCAAAGIPSIKYNMSLSGRDPHGPHSRTGRCNVQHLALEGGAPEDSAHARRESRRGRGLGTDYLFFGSRDSGGSRVLKFAWRAIRTIRAFPLKAIKAWCACWERWTG